MEIRLTKLGEAVAKKAKEKGNAAGSLQQPKPRMKEYARQIIDQNGRVIYAGWMLVDESRLFRAA